MDILLNILPIFIRLQTDMIQLPSWADSVTTKGLMLIAIWYFMNQLQKRDEKIDTLTNRILDIEKTNVEVMTEARQSSDNLTKAIEHLTEKIDLIINNARTQ